MCGLSIMTKNDSYMMRHLSVTQIKKKSDIGAIRLWYFDDRYAESLP